MGKTTSQEAINNLAHGLGQLVWWDLSGTAIKPSDLRAIITDEGEDASFVPDIEPTRAIKDAARLFHEGRGHADRYRAEVIASARKQHVTVGILQRVRRGPKEIGWDQVSQATYTVGVGWGTVVNQTDQLGRLITMANHRMAHLDHAWIRPCLIQTRLSGWSSFTLRRQGGVYYVPNSFSDELQKLQRIVSKIGDSAIHILHVSDTDESRASIGNEARNHIAGSITELQEKIEEWNSNTSKVRASTMSNALLEFRALKDQAELYADALSIKATDLIDDVTDAEEELKRMIEAAGLGTGTTTPREVRASTLAKLAAAIEAGAKTGTSPLTIKVTPDEFSDAKLGLSRWCKFAWDWYETSYQQKAAKEVGYSAAFSKDPLEVTFTKLDADTDGDADKDASPPVNAEAESEPSVETAELEAPISAAAEASTTRTPTVTEVEPNVIEYTEEALTEMKPSELTKIAAKMNIKGRSTMRKAQKLAAILARQEAAAQAEPTVKAMSLAAIGDRITFRHDTDGLLETRSVYEKTPMGWHSVSPTDFSVTSSATLAPLDIACAESGADNYSIE